MFPPHHALNLRSSNVPVPVSLGAAPVAHERRRAPQFGGSLQRCSLPCLALPRVVLTIPTIFLTAFMQQRARKGEGKRERRKKEHRLVCAVTAWDREHCKTATSQASGPPAGRSAQSRRRDRGQAEPADTRHAGKRHLEAPTGMHQCCPGRDSGLDTRSSLCFPWHRHSMCVQQSPANCPCPGCSSLEDGLRQSGALSMPGSMGVPAPPFPCLVRGWTRRCPWVPSSPRVLWK